MKFADRIADVPKSFIREILKDALAPGTISFAGGLPNRDLFPIDAIERAAKKVFEFSGRDVLQYSNSEGYGPLREYISARYAARGIDVPPETILITNGSQQGLDLLAKTMLNEGDGVVIEEPGYLGAIQAFSLYRPTFLPVAVSEKGMDIDGLSHALKRRPTLLYTVPNFQNPSGITYPDDNRRALADVLRASKTLLIEDDPYGELRFSGTPQTSFRQLLPHQVILLGSFSKIIAPGFRIGWIAAPEALVDKLLVAKQASDLHTNQLSQCIVHRYLQDEDLGAHIRTIIDAYGTQKTAMVEAIAKHFPDNVHHTDPEGGMFLWARLPEPLSALELFQVAARSRVLFVPGDPFYINRQGVNTLRLNFSCADAATIDTGIARLGTSIRNLINR